METREGGKNEWSGVGVSARLKARTHWVFVAEMRLDEEGGAAAGPMPVRPFLYRAQGAW